LEVLANKHIPTSAQYTICTSDCADIIRKIFKCSRARKVWRSLGPYNLISEAVETSRAGSKFLEYMINYSNFRGLHKVESNPHELILVSAWYIWWMRRNTVDGEKDQTPADVSIRVLADFNKLY
jgi:hypothetical protein